MREIEINKNTNQVDEINERGIKGLVLCPMTFSAPQNNQYQIPSSCQANCAWFGLQPYQDCVACYCQGKIIGILKTTDETSAKDCNNVNIQSNLNS